MNDRGYLRKLVVSMPKRLTKVIRKDVVDFTLLVYT